jgi:hypothetical protein
VVFTGTVVLDGNLEVGPLQGAVTPSCEHSQHPHEYENKKCIFLPEEHSFSEEPTAPIFRVEDGGSRLFRNVGNYVPDYITSYRRRF